MSYSNESITLFAFFVELKEKNKADGFFSRKYAEMALERIVKYVWA